VTIASAVDLGNLDPVIGKVEFKYTLLKQDEPKVLRRLGHGTRRKVYFYDTADLALKKVHLVLRFRTTKGEKDNSTVKLRPVPEDDDAWRAIPGIDVEGDMVGREFRLSAKLDDKRKADTAKPSEVGVLFAHQHALLAGVDLDTLSVLGPIRALVWELEDVEGFPYKLAVEQWNVEDELAFLELSCKVEAAAAPEAATRFTELLKRLKLDPDAPQVTKTDQVLNFFAAQL
jgi:hypothetical protein